MLFSCFWGSILGYFRVLDPLTKSRAVPVMVQIGTSFFFQNLPLYEYIKAKRHVLLRIYCRFVAGMIERQRMPVTSAIQTQIAYGVAMAPSDDIAARSRRIVSLASASRGPRSRGSPI